MAGNRNTAVVAIHGVGNHTPGGTAEALADLLCASPQYSAFTGRSLRVQRQAMVSSPLPRGADAGLQFMAGQLSGYRPPAAGAVYDTTVLEGRKTTAAGVTNVHVHEVFWADLSRAGHSAYRVFAELYQLLLHLPSLGVNSLDAVAAHEGSPASWRVAKWLENLARALLTIPIPLINLLVLALIPVTLVDALPPKFHLLAVTVGLLMAVIGVVLAIKFLAMPESRFATASWFLLPFLCLGVGIIVPIAWRNRPELYNMLSVEAAALGLVAAVIIAKQYEKMRAGAFAFACAGAAIVAGLLGYFLMQGDAGQTRVGATVAALYTFEFINLAGALSWGVFVIVALMAAVAGLVAAASAADRQKALRATWTARFALALPAALFATVTLSGWLLVTNALRRILPTAFFKPIALWLVCGGRCQKTTSVPAFLHEMVIESASGGAVLIFAVTVLLFVLAAVWVSGPSIWYEIIPPQASDKLSELSGRWLSRAFYVVGGAGDFLTIGMFVIAVLTLGNIGVDSDVVRRWIEQLLYATSGALVLVFTVKYVSDAFQVGVDILLDVDNYMRQSPPDKPPRARIAERFVSLLRYLSGWRDSSGNGYDRVIIIAHSQGSVIAADCLRFLAAVPDPKIRPMNIVLFTVGSPLKQLYAQTFPAQYAWMDRPVVKPAANAAIPTQAPPDPAGLAIVAWVNAYRSADYVGRYFWGDDVTSPVWVRPAGAASPNVISDDTRTEFCLGTGAHTHYWDSYGGDVAAALDALI